MSMWNNMLRLLLALVAVAGLAAPAAADVFRIGEFAFTPGEGPGQYELSATMPELLASNDPLTLPDGCVEAGRERAVDATLARLSVEIACEQPLAPGDRIVTPWAVDGATFVSTISGAPVRRALQPEGDNIVLPVGETAVQQRTLPQVAVEYTWQGIVHILGGWDHLAFVLCLCLLARGRRLLALVTTFTMGHSLSLALAFFDVIRVPVPPVEAVIALSIAFMAREAIRAGGGHVATHREYRRQLAVVAGFGLLHGLGFATVLRELGVLPDERLSGLLFFNAGVELGQLAFVSAVLAVMALAGRVGQQQRVRMAALYGAGITGCFWMIERVAGFTPGLA
ncbi:HupE/UreJ family protein [Sphingomonas sp. IW22]|uniref:HupE/UreJ family protein n=1 Tax=Sphingomonas sp. IW22 TaxID=3242489 RepID=UPI00351FD580